ncbi:polysaccharide pyruvyl transferase family protein [uncultured Gordonia sp.]|uniref:polysaccharide pyruvyl transferase family protein n=1 Tax=uncultured Gordonia sp. TaxID=198437 RepID=UPI0026034F70|nr:polysaccharide pyruvyl transferase family protein [uncultured Gordonia sp.]
MQIRGVDPASVVDKLRDPGLMDKLRRREIIYLIAPSGYPNYGDELIARAWLRYLSKERPRATVVLDCHSPGQATLLFRGIHPRTIFVDTIWKLTVHAGGLSGDVDGTDGLDPDRPWEWVASAATEFGHAPGLAEGVDLFRRAASVHLLGGGYVNNVWPYQVSLVSAAAALARSTGARAYATGLGLMPTVDEPALAALRDAAGAFSLFDVRDTASAAALGDDARLGGDDAWLAWGERRLLSRRPKPVSGGVTLCIQADLTDDFAAFGQTGVDALAEVVRRTLDSWDVPGSAVTVVEGIPGKDMTVPVKLADRLKGSTSVSFLDIWRRGLPAGRGDTWISTRFHPHLIAAAAGDSGVALVPRPDYYATKHSSLADIGSRWTIADDPEQIPDRPTAGGFPPAHRLRAVDAKRAVAAGLDGRKRVRG